MLTPVLLYPATPVMPSRPSNETKAGFDCTQRAPGSTPLTPPNPTMEARTALLLMYSEYPDPLAPSSTIPSSPSSEPSFGLPWIQT